MKRLTFLITSGPTREYIDPVRYISNESSGKMGAALCEAVLKLGHKAVFISGKVSRYPSGKAEVINVTSADDMFKAVKKNLKKADIIIGAAAVADFRPAVFSKNKIKKKNFLSLKLKQNPDILAYCGKNKKKRVAAGFALETGDLIKAAEKKLKSKNLDLIIANGAQSLGADKTSVIFIRKLRPAVIVENLSKKRIAEKIIDETISIFENIKTYKKLA
jgi:phosphopantothenoylcysteine synthetase/decarboxylase